MTTYNPHLIYSVPDFVLDGNWTLDFWLNIKAGRSVGSGSYDEYFMSIESGKFFRLDTESRPHLHCTWLGFMGDEITGISGPLDPDQWYHFALVHTENSQWYFYVNGVLKSQGVDSSNTGGGGSE